jgi:hypothetical protein
MHLLTATSFVWGIAFLASIAPALEAYTLFEDPAMANSPGGWMLFSCLVTFPIILAGTIAVSWIAYARRRYRLALWINLLPVVEILLATLAFSIS